MGDYAWSRRFMFRGQEACIETSLRVARDILGGEILDCSGMESWPKGRRGGDEGL